MSIKKEKRNKLIFGLFIILLMVSSTLGFMYSGSDSVKINGHKFVLTEQGWKLWLDELDSYLYFNYLPDELGYDLDSFDFNFGFVKIYNEDWNDGAVQRLQSIFLFKGIHTELVSESGDCDEDILILSDEDLDPSVTVEQKCLYFEGDYVKITEGVIYKIFEIV
jgi:hypothetical protein